MLKKIVMTIMKHYNGCEEFRRMVNNAKTLIDMYDIEEYLNRINLFGDVTQSEIVEQIRYYTLVRTRGRYDRLEFNVKLLDLYLQKENENKNLELNDYNDELFK